VSNFLRTAVDESNKIRGMARLIAAPLNTAWPSKEAALSQMVKLSSSGTANDVQTITISGTPTGGTFQLRFLGENTEAIKYNATAAEVQAALRALPSVGGNVKCSGGPLPGTGVVVEFVEYFAKTLEPLIEVSTTTLTGGTTPKVEIAHTTPGVGQYDPVAPWFDLGATKTGAKITRNNTEDVFEIDQVHGDLDAAPTNWTMSIVTALAEVSLARLQFGWELGETFIDATPATGPEMHLGIGLPTNYVKRRFAVLYQRPNGLIRAVAFRRVIKMPQESDINFQKQGEQQTIPITFRALIDPTVQDPNQTIGEIIDQANE